MQVNNNAAQGGVAAKSAGAAPPKGKFLYFAYGSDMKLDRLRAGCCPSGEAFTPAKVVVLRGRQFAYTLDSKVWKGGVADIPPAQGEEVWGALYAVSERERAALDKQKGADKATPSYTRLNVQVEDPETGQQF